ncbi:type I polyketide synthase [Vitiosangium sp. GDMCC 1.1324]|uniref:type I polyketide synthase n=1 Tax=Vitiosangium sp. (strain GDMCC 1.1324) TaxID=2138576 RepID=UPI000D3B20E5|nr:type I polyketide synthase [Vitiosangium sp. GDMCC 1.1324]PTL76608.1 polyketide synthase [Vitiosangium sp. GDMCC 1.1324]
MRRDESLSSPEVLQARLISLVSERTTLPAGSIDIREPLSRYGLDSAGALELLAELSAAVGRPLPATLLWEYPTLEALRDHLAGVERTGPARAPEASAAVGQEPIAVIGLACRFPGAPDAAAFWRLLREGVDAVTEVPPERWNLDAFYDADPSVPGKMNTRWGGFLDGVDRFEPQFFGISPREALDMDPQQRLALEAAWGALEDAGLAPGSLKGSRTGVFFGAMFCDYSRLPGAGGAATTSHTATGQDASIISARVSYTLGLQGPSLVVSTACSSSLVAVHLACQSLRSGESSLAIAGGVNLLLSPQSTVAMSKFGGLSPDGRCFSFDARANGYVRGEGVGAIVLKPLSRALADGDTIQCLLLGSAVNNDGASNGLTAPNPRAQEDVLRRAWAQAGVQPSRAHYVEAHGTGTLLGDPIEARALGTVLGEGRPSERPLRLGSVKSNIGHLEAAAGIAGLIKVALCMRQGALPASLHLQRPNPHIPFEELGLQVQRALEPWPGAEEEPATAGVSSFGFGGTNCHVVLQQWRAREAELFPLAAASAGALREKARRVLGLLGSPEGRGSVASVSHAARRLGGGTHRLAVTVRSRQELERHLSAFVAGETRAGLAVGEASARAPLVFIFSGQGGQWPAMGRSLLRGEPVFRSVLERCDGLIRPLLGWSLLEELSVEGSRSRLDEAEVGWPATVALELALAELWRSWGIEPDAVIGYSIGEVAAACVAGCLSLEDAMRVICAQARLIGRTRGQGAMALVSLPWEQAGEVLAGYAERVHRAIHAAPDATVLTGEPDAIASVVETLRGQGISCWRVSTDVPAHAPRLEPMRDELREALREVRPGRAYVPLYSTVTGARLDGTRMDGDYWADHFTRPVLFSQALGVLAGQVPASCFLELGPHSTLKHPVGSVLSRAGREALVLPSLRRGEDGQVVTRDTLGALYALGHPVRWSTVLPPEVREESWPLVVALGGDVAPEPEADEPSPCVLPLSARGEAALQELARAYQERLAQASSLRDMAYCAGVHRSHHEQRLAVLGRSRKEVGAALEAFLRGERPPSVHLAPPVVGGRRKLVFVFSGQGSQWVGMGRQLLASEPVFRRALEACDSLLRPLCGWSLLEELAASEEHSRLQQTEVTQPALFALQVALVALWESWGVVPDAVLGHSIGEVAAAHASGALGLEEAVRVVHHRGRLMQRATGKGRMVAVELPASELAPFLAGREQRLALAAVNDPSSCVLSGDPEAVDEVVALLERQGVTCRRLRVDYAFHSPQMEPLQGELARALDGLRPGPTTVALYSTVTGSRLAGEELGADYWARNIRAPVLFSDAVHRVLDDGHTVFLEVGPHPVLSHNVLQCLEARGTEGQAIASLRRGQEETRTVKEALAALYVRGCEVDWRRVYPGARTVPLPAYRWQRERYWPKERSEKARRSTGGGHPLLGAPLSVAALRGARCWEQALSVEGVPYLSDHRVQGEVVVPGAAYVELGLAAASAAYAGAPCALEAVSFQRMLTLPPEGERTVQVVLTEKEPGLSTFDVYSQRPGVEEGDAWLHHASGSVRRGARSEPRPSEPSPDTLRSRLASHWSGAEHYQHMTATGLEYGDAFQGVRELWRGAEEVLGRVRLPEGATSQLAAYRLHPALLDACIQVVMTLLTGAGEGAAAGAVETLVPVGVESLRVHRRPEREVWALARRAGQPLTSDLLLLNEAGEVLVEVKGLRVQRLEGGVGARPAGEEWLYSLEWKRHEGAVSGQALTKDGAWLVFQDEAKTGGALAGLLEARGQRCVRVVAGERYEKLEPGLFRVDAASPEDYRRVLKDAFGDTGCQGVVHLWSLDVSTGAGTEELERARMRGSQSALYLAQALVRQGWRDTPGLWLVTRGAHAVKPGEDVSMAQAPLWGFGRALALEHPELRTTLVDVVGETQAQAEALLAELGATDGETQLAWRGDARHVARLVRGTYEALGGEPVQLKADATYLLTGGLGGLGLTVAKWMVEKGARNLVLMGRSEPTGEARQALQELEKAGARVVVARADVSKREQVESVLQRVNESLPPLKGVLHAAAVLEDRTVLEMDGERFNKPLAPKMRGAWNLHSLTADKALDFFVMYSSAAALLGFPGQSNYAAANAFMDALARHRRSHGLPGLSINWGAFSEVGMAAAQANRGERLSYRGVGSLQPAQGAAVLERLLTGRAAQVAVMQFDARQWLEFYPNATAPLWTELLAEQEKAKAREARGVRFRETLAQAEPAQRGALVEEHLAEQISHVLGLEASKLDRMRAFGELGLDSLMSLELRNRLEASLGLKLSATLLFTYPNLAALSRHVVDKLELPAGQPAQAPTATTEPLPGAPEAHALLSAEVEQMSDEEAERLLLESLDALSTELRK